MKKTFGKWTITAALAFMLCMTLLVMSGTAFSAGLKQCVDNGDGTVTDNNAGLYVAEGNWWLHELV